MGIFETFFPSRVENSYEGPKIVVVLYALVTVVSVVRSLIHMFLHDGGAESIATIPLSAFPPEASDVIIGLFALWGLSQLLSGIFFAMVLWRYRSLIPLMWVFIYVYELLARTDFCLTSNFF